jgi:hypothetical protein
MSQWSLIYENFEPAQEERREDLGKGYFATLSQQVAGHQDRLQE